MPPSRGEAIYRLVRRTLLQVPQSTAGASEDRNVSWCRRGPSSCAGRAESGRAPGFGSSRRRKGPAPCPADQARALSVRHLGDEVLVARDLQGLNQLRLETVRSPDPLNAA